MPKGTQRHEDKLEVHKDRLNVTFNNRGDTKILDVDDPHGTRVHAVFTSDKRTDSIRVSNADGLLCKIDRSTPLTPSQAHANNEIGRGVKNMDLLQATKNLITSSLFNTAEVDVPHDTLANLCPPRGTTNKSPRGK